MGGDGKAKRIWGIGIYRY
jgi:hypothetical protein